LTKFELSILIEKTVTNISDELLHEKGNRKHILLQLAYRGVAGEKLFHFLKKCIADSLPNELNARIIFKGTPLSSHFNIKDKTNKGHLHNIVYKITCPEASCQQTYGAVEKFNNACRNFYVSCLIDISSKLLVFSYISK